MSKCVDDSEFVKVIEGRGTKNNNVLVFSSFCICVILPTTLDYHPKQSYYNPEQHK